MIDNSRQAVYGYDQQLEAFGSLDLKTLPKPIMKQKIVLKY
ncbi:hypothetical protein [Oceanobacillus zhaokaii]|nr:hypothetical protein [Oceanobacillus zhaokaii]